MIHQLPPGTPKVLHHWLHFLKESCGYARYGVPQRNILASFFFSSIYQWSSQYYSQHFCSLWVQSSFSCIVQCLFFWKLINLTRVRAFHKLVGNVLATCRISSNFKFCILSNFSCYLLIRDIGAVFNASIGLSSIFHNVLVDNLWISCKKKANLPPPRGRSWAQDKRSRPARSAVFRENSKEWTKILLILT